MKAENDQAHHDFHFYPDQRILNLLEVLQSLENGSEVLCPGVEHTVAPCFNGKILAFFPATIRAYTVTCRAPI